ncbi:winged helix-turn-helix transcriptional regulator [Ideonella dechloratans]|uniref:Winged helix-turn-helix transcriptional regulator n=1 Tax=Ideonella dechloratans TaxID=36863 RepID=A0A643FBI5_IDEDE|nr:MarR family winged helix-turn-helix transcriptional regulator [Ideonella dechloratans]KAB0581599.1 winged helix-turn-helix transcriptional regulator [Ideonella dechloratans]
MVNPCTNVSADLALQSVPVATVLDEPAARVLRRFRQVFNAVKTHFQQVERQVGVGGAQVWALSVIQSRPGIGVNELAQALDIRQSTASNLVRALVDRGLVATTRAERDRRAVELRLLAPGAEVLAQSPGPFSGVLPVALAQLDEATLARMEADLTRLIGLLDADEASAGLPLASM